MHISIADNAKKRFYAAGAIPGLIRSQVVVEMIEQWLKAIDASTSDVVKE
ncbi:MAG: hypothetical protein PUP91_16420 [Rhizonema sp. PD37]|nr:hypothetical protein [Rhizonema sp. PD37]